MMMNSCHQLERVHELVIKDQRMQVTKEELCILKKEHLSVVVFWKTYNKIIKKMKKEL